MFTLEVILWTIAEGVLLTPNAYLFDPWHWMDLIILLSMYLGLFSPFVSNSGFPRAGNKLFKTKLNL